MFTVDEQQFGLWIRAPQFNPARKAIVEVQGYDSGHPKSFIGVSRRATLGQIIKSESHVKVDNLIREESRMKLIVLMEGLAMEDDGSGEDSANGKTRKVAANHAPLMQTLDFKELIRDIDDAIYTYPVVSNSNFNSA